LARIDVPAGSQFNCPVWPPSNLVKPDPEIEVSVFETFGGENGHSVGQVRTIRNFPGRPDSVPVQDFPRRGQLGGNTLQPITAGGRSPAIGRLG
jgi:hypothetical protein